MAGRFLLFLASFNVFEDYQQIKNQRLKNPDVSALQVNSTTPAVIH